MGKKIGINDVFTPHNKPAIVICAFGSSGNGKSLFEGFHRKVMDHYGDFHIRWAYTSKIIRAKTGSPSLREALAAVVEEGYRSCIVLPLQIFPGSEYRKIAQTASDVDDLHILVGETLMHRWGFVKDVLKEIEKSFLAPVEGLNILAMHGTPVTTEQANAVYLGIESMVRSRYENVLAASLEGVPDDESLFQKIARENMAEKYQRVRIHPLLLVAGKHVRQDIMGGRGSWKQLLEELGFEVECPTIEQGGEQIYRSLGSHPVIVEFFLDRLGDALRKCGDLHLGD